MNFRNILITISLVVSLSLSFLLHPSWSLSKWLDSLFLVGLLLLVIYAIIVLIEAEFSSAFIKSFKHFYSRINKNLYEKVKNARLTLLIMKKASSIRKAFSRLASFSAQSVFSLRQSFITSEDDA